jgi:hypothetical protein
MNFRRKGPMENTIRNLVNTLVTQLVAAVEADIAQRVQQAMSAAFSGVGAPVAKRGPGRPPRNPVAAFGAYVSAVAGPVAPIKRRPKQLCPVPNCKGLAAPVFGMVCVEHKDLPKAQIKKYRLERREAKKASK